MLKLTMDTPEATPSPPTPDLRQKLRQNLHLIIGGLVLILGIGVGLVLTGQTGRIRHLITGPKPTPTPTPVAPSLPTPLLTSTPTPTSITTPTPTPQLSFGCEKLTANHTEGTTNSVFSFACQGQTAVEGDAIDQVRFTFINQETGNFESITQPEVTQVGQDADGTAYFEAKLDSYRFTEPGEYQVQAQVHSRALDTWHPADF